MIDRKFLHFPSLFIVDVRVGRSAVRVDLTFLRRVHVVVWANVNNTTNVKVISEK